MEEVREYVENGITPEGLIQPVHDPDTQLSSEGEREKEERDKRKANDTETAVPDNDKPPRKKEIKSKASQVHVVGTRRIEGRKSGMFNLMYYLSLSLSIPLSFSLCLSLSLSFLPSLSFFSLSLIEITLQEIS